MSDDPARNLRDRYESALSLAAFVDQARKNVDLWKAVIRRAHVPVDLVHRTAGDDLGSGTQSTDDHDPITNLGRTRWPSYATRYAGR